MKRFRFRLSRLEALRAGDKRRARAALAAAMADLHDRESDRAALEEELAEALASGPEPERAADPRVMEAFDAWRQGLHLRAGHAREEERAARGKVADATTGYREASRAHRVLELLRERRFRRWLDQARYEEQKLLEEMHRFGDGRRRRRSLS